VPGEDICDPKFAQIHGTLFLYALKNTHFEPEPYGTVVSTTADGVKWSDFAPVEPQGWLFWRPETFDGQTWYVTAYWPSRTLTPAKGQPQCKKAQLSLILAINDALNICSWHASPRTSGIYYESGVAIT
jgi:hypothetical protein